MHQAAIDVDLMFLHISNADQVAQSILQETYDILVLKHACFRAQVCFITTEPISKSYATVADRMQPSLALDFLKRHSYFPQESRVNLVQCHFLHENQSIEIPTVFVFIVKLMLFIFSLSISHLVDDDPETTSKSSFQKSQWLVQMIHFLCGGPFKTAYFQWRSTTTPQHLGGWQLASRTIRRIEPGLGWIYP